MNCTNCGHPMPDNARFCPSCGQPCKNESDMMTDSQEPIQLQNNATKDELNQKDAVIPPNLEMPQNTSFVPQDGSTTQDGFSNPMTNPPVTPSQNIPYPNMGVPPFPPTGVPKRRPMPIWALIAICALGLVTFCVVVWLILSSLKKPVINSEAVSESIGEVTPLPTDAPIEEPELVFPKEGEYLFTGHSSYDEIEDISLSFILSADRTYIHDIVIEITNLNSSIENGATTEVSVPHSTECYSGEYPLEFDSIMEPIVLGKSSLTYLSFSEDLTYAELEYTYSQSGNMGTQPIEISFGSTWFDLTADGYFYEDGFSSDPYPNSSSTPTLEPTLAPKTNFDVGLLKNWNNAALQEAYGVKDIFEFTPENPMPMYYIVGTESIYDPVAEKESEGGYEKDSSRHMPINTDDLIRETGNLEDGGLTLTDDPNKATYYLMLYYNYTDNIQPFTFSDGTVVNQYHGTFWAMLVNCITGEAISSEIKTQYATYANESVYTSMLNAAKGKQFYAGAPSLTAEDFEGYWDFINKKN